MGNTGKLIKIWLKIKSIRRGTGLKKDGYKNSVLHQVCDLKELAEIQREKCFDLDELSGIMEAKDCAGVKRVILTGCRDS